MPKGSFIKLWKFFIFLSKDKRQAIILTMPFVEYLHVFDSKSNINLRNIWNLNLSNHIVEMSFSIWKTSLFPLS